MKIRITNEETGDYCEVGLSDKTDAYGVVEDLARCAIGYSFDPKDIYEAMKDVSAVNLT